MKKIFLLFFVILCSVQAKAQTESRIKETYIHGQKPFSSVEDRINIDFEIKGNPQVSKTTLAQIDLIAVEQHRQPNTRTEIVDTLTGLTLVVYSAEETTLKKIARLSSTIDANPHSQTKQQGE